MRSSLGPFNFWFSLDREYPDDATQQRRSSHQCRCDQHNLFRIHSRLFRIHSRARLNAIPSHTSNRTRRPERGESLPGSRGSPPRPRDRRSPSGYRTNARPGWQVSGDSRAFQRNSFGPARVKYLAPDSPGGRQTEDLSHRPLSGSFHFLLRKNHPCGTKSGLLE
jgi:hypothetical protein